MYTITTKQPPALTIFHTYCTGGTKHFTAATQYIITFHWPNIDGEFLVRGCVKTAIFYLLFFYLKYYADQNCWQTVNFHWSN